MIKAILFDLDNTLYDYDPAHKAGLNAAKTILKKEINLQPRKFDKLYKLSKDEIYRELSGTAASHNKVLHFQRLIEKTHNTVDPKVILELYDAYWNHFLKQMTLKKDVINTLKQIKELGLNIAIVSDLTTHIQLRKLEKLKIQEFVDILVTSEEAGSEKPHAIMFLLTLNKLHLRPEEVFYVGDDFVRDIEGANSVGIKSILISNKKRSRLKSIITKNIDYRKPNFVITKISELINIIKNN